MENPIVDLELDPSSGEKIQCSSWLELSWLSRHESFADQSWIWCPQLFFGWLLAVFPREVATKSHPRTAHLGHGE